jgi:hypothetical protein
MEGAVVVEIGVVIGGVVPSGLTVTVSVELVEAPEPDVAV